MFNSLLGKDEVASIATEDEDALLASDSEDHNTVTELKGNGTFEKVIDLEDGELEDGEIGVNDVNEDDDPNICRFVVAGTNSDLHSIPTNSFKSKLIFPYKRFQIRGSFPLQNFAFITKGYVTFNKIRNEK